MSELSKSADLESSSTRGFPTTFSIPEHEGHRAALDMIYELKKSNELLQSSVAELKKIRNKLWNIEDAIANPRNEPEYDTIDGSN